MSGHVLYIYGKDMLKSSIDISLLQFGLITFRFAYMRTLKTLISVISELLAVSLSSKTIYFYLWRHQDTPKNPRKPGIFFQQNISGN